MHEPKSVLSLVWSPTQRITSYHLYWVLCTFFSCARYTINFIQIRIPAIYIFSRIVCVLNISFHRTISTSEPKKNKIASQFPKNDFTCTHVLNRIQINMIFNANMKWNTVLLKQNEIKTCGNKSRCHRTSVNEKTKKHLPVNLALIYLKSVFKLQVLFKLMQQNVTQTSTIHISAVTLVFALCNWWMSNRAERKKNGQFVIH